MTWADGTPTLICEECGHVDRPESFVWVLGELAICQNGTACHRRQERNAWIENAKRQKIHPTKKQSWLKKILPYSRIR